MLLQTTETIQNVIMPLQISDIIQIVGIIVSLITSTIAIIISVLALRQNNRMMEESSRPNIAVYFDYTYGGSPTQYFILKNFGNSDAKIVSISYSPSLRNISDSLANIPWILDRLPGTYMMPGQKHILPFTLYDSTADTVTFDIEYQSSEKTYHYHTEIFVSRYKKFTKQRGFPNDEFKSISYPLQEIIERIM